MINKALFTSNKENWETPIDFFNRLNKKFHFNWDLAAEKHNHKVANYFTKEDDSLAQDWGGLKETYS